MSSWEEASQKSCKYKVCALHHAVLCKWKCADSC